MSTSSGVRSRPSRADEGDKAVWISFADLMTALMVLFLMVMVVTLLAITKALPNASSGAQKQVKREIATTKEPAATMQPDMASTAAFAASATGATDAASASSDVVGETDRDPQAAAVETLLKKLAQAVDSSPGIHLDTKRHVIDFGDRARFATGSHRLTPDSANRLREFAPSLLSITQSELGRRWIRRVVVEGFADARGSYLYNLHLSLERGERVLCTLLDRVDATDVLDAEQRAAIRSIFAVGGFSFNDPRSSLDESRRIELRIEFGPPPAAAPAAPTIDVGNCALDF